MISYRDLQCRFLAVFTTRKSLLQSIFELHEEFADFLSCSVPGTYQFDTVEASVGVIY